MKTPGRIAHEAYRRENVYWMSEYDIELEWENSNASHRGTWENIAKAVIESQPCQHPFRDVKWEWFDRTTGEPVLPKCNKCGKRL